MIKRLWLGVGLLLAAATAPAAPPPAELFFKDAELREAVLSPSGRRLAVTMAKDGSRYGVYVFDFGERPKLSRAALFREVDVQQIRWLNDERLLYSTADLAEGSGSYPGKPGPGLFSVNHDGSLPRELIERGGDSRAGREANLLQQKVLGPNHALLAVPRQAAAGADEVLVLDRVRKPGGEVNALPLWLDTRTGRTRRVDWEVPDDAISWLVDPQGDARVVVTRDGGRLQVRWRAPGERDWKPLTEGTVAEGLPFVPTAVDERGQLYVRHRIGREGYSVLNRLDAASGKPAAQALVSVPGFDFDGNLVQDEASGAVLGVRVTADAETTVWFGAAMKRFQQEVDARFPGTVNRISCRRCGEADMVALVRSFSDRDPGRLHVYRAEGKAWQAIGALRAGVDPAQMASVDFQRIPARDGRSLPLWITRPTGASTALPAVVLVHGGPWVRGNRWEWEAMAQFLASRRYLVIEPEFRGSRGYGYLHERAGWKQWGQAMQDDVADALLWARQQGLANDRACIAGASYGGYSTLMGLARHPELYRCGIAWLAVTDLELLVKGNLWAYDDVSDVQRRESLPLTVGDAVKDLDMLRANSPVLLAEQIKAPLLMGFGEADRRVPLAHGERMRDALKAVGREPEFQVYTGEGHGFGALRNRLDWAARVERFLAQHLSRP